MKKLITLILVAMLPALAPGQTKLNVCTTNTTAAIDAHTLSLLLPHIYLLTTNAYAVNGVTNTFANCDAMLHAALSDPALKAGTNLLHTFPYGAVFELNNFDYPFETPLLFFVPASYPATYVVQSGIGNMGRFRYDGPTNSIGTGYGLKADNVVIPNGLITVGRTNVDIDANGAAVNFLTRNVGYFAPQGSNTLLLVFGFNDLEVDHCYFGESTILTSNIIGQQGVLMELGNVLSGQALDLRLLDAEARADNDLKIHNNFFDGGEAGIIARSDHGHVYDNRIGGIHGADGGTNYGCVVCGFNLEGDVDHNHIVLSDVGLSMVQTYLPTFQGQDIIWDGNYQDELVTTMYNVVYDPVPQVHGIPTLRILNQKGSTFTSNDGHVAVKDNYLSEVLTVNGGGDLTLLLTGQSSESDTADMDVSLIAPGDSDGDSMGNLNLDAGTNGNQGVVNIGGQASQINLKSPLVANGASGLNTNIDIELVGGVTSETLYFTNGILVRFTKP